MSRLITLDPDITLIKEPEGYQFGKQIRSNDNVTDAEVKLVSLAPVASASKTGNLAHDDLGHNGSARTYMIVRRNYY